MKRKNIIYMLLLFIISFVFPLQSVDANENDSPYLLEWEDDIVIRGEEGYTKNFYLPKNMKVSEGELYLDFALSPTLIKDVSSITILINDVEVDSEIIEELETIKIPIDEDSIEKGVNSLTIKAFLKSTKDDCEINNDINWVILKKNSYLSFQMERENSEYVRELFENTYYSDGKNTAISIVVPDELEAINYNQISNISALMGYSHRGKDLKTTIDVYTYDDLETLDHEAVVVGTTRQLEGYFEKLLSEKDWTKASETGLITLKEMGENKHFFLITNTEEDLLLLNDTLSDNKLMSQLDNDLYFLDEENITQRKPFNENPFLSELGYETSQQKGNVENTFNYYFSIPGNKRLGENNELSFLYNYPSSIIGEDANILVSINDEEQFTYKISSEKEEDTIKFTIPEKYEKFTRFNISLKFNLNPHKVNCLSRMDENAWVQVDADESVFRFDLKNRKQYNLLSSHGLVEDNQGVLDQNILLDSFESIEINSLTELASYLGENSQGVKKISIIEDRKDEQLDSSFIIGLNNSNTIKNINNELKVSVSEKGEFLNENLFIQNTSPLAGIQLTHANDKIVISSDEKDQLNQGIKNYSLLLNDEEIIILKDKRVLFSSKEETVLKNKVAKGKQISKEVFVSVLTLLGGILFIFIIYKKL